MTEFVLVSGSKEAFCAKMSEALNGREDEIYNIHYFEPRADSFNGYEWYSAIIEFYGKEIESADEAVHPVTPPDSYYWDHVVD